MDATIIARETTELARELWRHHAETEGLEDFESALALADEVPPALAELADAWDPGAGCA